MIEVPWGAGIRVAVLIPARMDSSRFPGKPLAPILGIPMIEHVYARSAQCPSVTVAVATCDDEIRKCIEGIGGKVVMTSNLHVRASDRCAEAIEILESESGERFDFVVMVQGDEPLVRPEMIVEALTPLIRDPAVVVSNLLGVIDTEGEFNDRNCIKVVVSVGGDALYFSREPIPTTIRTRDVPKYKQICVIPFARAFLSTYCLLEPTPLELAESIDMLRVLEHGYSVRMVGTVHSSLSIDLPSDVAEVERALTIDPLYHELFVA